GAGGRSIDVYLLRGDRVDIDRRREAGRGLADSLDAVAQHDLIARAAAVHGDAADRIPGRRGSADVLIRQPATRHAGNQRRHVISGAARWDVVDDFAADDALPLRVLHVDDGRLAGDGDRFLERPDAHLGVDLG